MKGKIRYLGYIRGHLVILTKVNGRMGNVMGWGSSSVVVGYIKVSGLKDTKADMDTGCP